MTQLIKNFQPSPLVSCIDYMAMIAGTNNSSAHVPANLTTQQLQREGLAGSEGEDGLKTPRNEEMAAVAHAERAPYIRNKILHNIGAVFSHRNMKRFIPMSHRAQDANAAIALYAGDGIVAKITQKGQLVGLRPFGEDTKPLPGVLPPLLTEYVGDYVVELFPYVRTGNVKPEEVGKMQEELAKYNLHMKRNDDRADNIGRLRNGGLVVLDGNAVEKLDDSKPITGHEEWQEVIKKDFYPLYDPQKRPEKLVNDEPNFGLHFSPLITDHDRTDGPAKPKEAPPGSFWSRMLGRDAGNRGTVTRA